MRCFSSRPWAMVISLWNGLDSFLTHFTLTWSSCSFQLLLTQSILVVVPGGTCSQLVAFLAFHHLAGWTCKAHLSFLKEVPTSKCKGVKTWWSKPWPIRWEPEDKYTYTFFITSSKSWGLSQSGLDDPAPPAQLGTSSMTYLCIGFQVSNLSSSSCFLPWTSRSPGTGWGHLLHVQTPLQVYPWKLPAAPDISASHQILSEAQGGKNVIYWQSLRTSQEAEKLPSI